VAGRAAPATPGYRVTGLLLDEMYPPSLAERLRDHGHDVVAALEVQVGLSSKSDDDVLAWAARNNRCVVTENVRDFARLAPVTPHAGIIFVSSRGFPRTRNGLARLAAALDDVMTAKRLPPADGAIWLSLPDQAAG
jgi:Domain of unknown function (DUF5615)